LHVLRQLGLGRLHALAKELARRIGKRLDAQHPGGVDGDAERRQLDGGRELLREGRRVQHDHRHGRESRPRHEPCAKPSDHAAPDVDARRKGLRSNTLRSKTSRR